MSLQPQPGYTVVAETAKVAREIFPKGNLCITMVDCLASFLCDQDFSAIFPMQGQPGVLPWRLALATILQYIEGLTDRQAVDAVLSSPGKAGSFAILVKGKKTEEDKAKIFAR